MVATALVECSFVARQGPHARMALGLALAGPWPGPWLARFRPFPVQTSSSSDRLWFRPVLVRTGSVQVVPVRFAAILKKKIFIKNVICS